MTAQTAKTDESRPAILFIGGNSLFLDFVTAVGIAAGIDVAGLAAEFTAKHADCRRLSEHVARTYPATRFQAAIVDMARPDHDAAIVLPQLAAAGSIAHLVILVDDPSPSALARAERLARTIAPWMVEVWEKPIHAGFLKSRLVTISGSFSEAAEADLGQFPN